MMSLELAHELKSDHGPPRQALRWLRYDAWVSYRRR